MRCEGGGRRWSPLGGLPARSTRPALPGRRRSRGSSDLWLWGRSGQGGLRGGGSKVCCFGRGRCKRVRQRGRPASPRACAHACAACASPRGGPRHRTTRWPSAAQIALARRLMRDSAAHAVIACLNAMSWTATIRTAVAASHAYASASQGRAATKAAAWRGQARGPVARRWPRSGGCCCCRGGGCSGSGCCCGASAPGAGAAVISRTRRRSVAPGCRSAGSFAEAVACTHAPPFDRHTSFQP